MNDHSPSDHGNFSSRIRVWAATFGIAPLLFASTCDAAEDPHKIASRYYSQDRTTVAELLDDRAEIDVQDVGGSRRSKLSNFDNTVRGAKFYDGNHILTVYVGGPAAGIWPEFFQRKADGSYTRFGVEPKTGLPKEVSTMLPKDFDYARMWISCVGWEGADIAKIEARVRPTHESEHFEEPFVFTFNVVTGKIVAQIKNPPLLSRDAHVGRQLHATGTGFYIDWAGLIVTAKHVVENEDDIEVVDSNGKQHAATILALGASDVALLKVDAKPPGVVPIRSGTRLPLGTRLCTMGFPQNPEHGGEGSLELSEGVLSAYQAGDRGQDFQFSAPVRPGNSGGAVIDDNGVLVGVVVAGYDPLKVFAKTGYSAVLMNLGEWTDAVLLLLPAGWTQANPPVLQDRSEAIKNLQTATVEVLLFKKDTPSAVAAGYPIATPNPAAPAFISPSDPLAEKQQALARAREADRKLTETYSALRSRLNSTGKTQLKELQLQWLKSRSAQTGSAELLAKGMSANTPALRQFAEMDEARTAALQAFLQSIH